MGLNKVESLDTSILLRILLQDNEELFEVAIKLLERKDVMFRVSDAALLEVAFVLTRMEVDRETIVGALTRIISRPNVKTSDLVGIELFALYLEYPQLSFIDCYLAIESAMEKVEPLWTFDKALAKKARSAKMP